MFTKAVAQAMQEARDMAPVEAPSVLRDLSGRRALLQQVIRFSIAVAIAASIATLLVMAIPSSHRPAGQDNPSLSAAWQSVKSSVTPAPQPPLPPKRTATLAVQDGSGLATIRGRSESTSASAAGASDRSRTDCRRPADVRQRVGSSEWRVSAMEISGVSAIPPEGFIGQMLVTAELRDGDGVALTGTSTRLTWAAAPSLAAVAPPRAAVPSPVAVVPPGSPWRAANVRVRGAASCRAAAAGCRAAAGGRCGAAGRDGRGRTVGDAGATAGGCRAQPRFEEIAALIKRGQDLLAGGDVQSARRC